MGGHNPHATNRTGGPAWRAGDAAMADVWAGDCFVVAASDGRCWSGERWVRLWSTARQFRRPDRAYELCEREVREAERRSGIAAMVCYIPPDTPTSFVLAPIPNLSQVDLRDLARRPEAC